MADEYLLWLGSRTNKHGVPYAKGTLGAYRDGVVALDSWMTREGVDGDFAACDTAMLNRFFADYRREHSQGGVNTKQRNLRHFFSWLAKEYGHPSPYDDPDLNRYRPAETCPTAPPGSCRSKAPAPAQRPKAGWRSSATRRPSRCTAPARARTRAPRRLTVAVARYARAVAADRQRDLADAPPPRRAGRLRPGHHAHPHVPTHLRARVPRRYGGSEGDLMRLMGGVTARWSTATPPTSPSNAP